MGNGYLKMKKKTILIFIIRLSISVLPEFYLKKIALR